MTASQVKGHSIVSVVTLWVISLYGSHILSADELAVLLVGLHIDPQMLFLRGASEWANVDVPGLGVQHFVLLGVCLL